MLQNVMKYFDFKKEFFQELFKEPTSDKEDTYYKENILLFLFSKKRQFWVSVMWCVSLTASLALQIWFYLQKAIKAIIILIFNLKLWNWHHSTAFGARVDNWFCHDMMLGDAL